MLRIFISKNCKGFEETTFPSQREGEGFIARNVYTHKVFVPIGCKMFGLEKRHADVELEVIDELSPSDSFKHRVNIFERGEFVKRVTLTYVQLTEMIAKYNLVEE